MQEYLQNNFSSIIDIANESKNATINVAIIPIAPPEAKTRPVYVTKGIWMHIILRECLPVNAKKRTSMVLLRILKVSPYKTVIKTDNKS